MNDSRFKRNPVYGLPTFWGLAMFVLVGTALWFSIYSQAPVDRWIAFLMVILILMHLAESNNPFRSLVFTILPFEPPFAHEVAWVEVEVLNNTQQSAEPLHLKFKGTDEWVTLADLGPQCARRIFVPLPAFENGKQQLPSLSIKMRPATQLFQLWKVLKSPAEFLVLPPSIDHGFALSNTRPQSAELELSHIESITDERLLYKMDHKLFLKTGKPYFRAHEATKADATLSLRWSSIEILAEKERAEQFSAWVKKASTLRTNPPPPPHASAGVQSAAGSATFIHIEAPFLRWTSTAAQMDWHMVKEKFADWLYERS